MLRFLSAFSSVFTMFLIPAWSSSPPVAAYPASLNLTAIAGSAPTIEPIAISPADPSGAWTASSDSNWLSLSATSGVGYSIVTVGADTTGLTPGIYTDQVRVQLADASKTPSSISVVVTLRLGIAPDFAPHAEWHVTPQGAPDGDGSADHPWDIVTALNGPKQVQPGDTIWLHDGRYGAGTFDAIIGSRLIGTKSAPIIVRAWPGERPIIDAWLQIGCCDGAPDITQGAYTWFWGIEFASYNPNRVSGNSGPPDYAHQDNHAGVDSWAPGTKIIDCIVHDTASGIEMWDEATDSEAYGNIVYNVGGYGPDRGHGHGFYMQNGGPYWKHVFDNIAFNNFGEGLQMYGSLTSFVQNFHVEGNVSFNNGAIGTGNNAANGTPQAGSRNNNLIIGAGNGGPKGIVLINNFTYHTPLADDGLNELSYPSTPRANDLTAIGNYFIGGNQAVDLFRWDSVVFNNNWIYAANLTETALAYRTDQKLANYTYDLNFYYGSGQFSVYPGCNADPCPKKVDGSFSDWQAMTQLDANSAFQPGRPTGTWTAVRQNLYEPGRAIVVVYNWDLMSDAVVDLSAAGLHFGDNFAIRDAQNWFGDPVASGVFVGQRVVIPMTGLKVALPNGIVPNPQPHTCPQFGAFVVLSGSALNTPVANRRGRKQPVRRSSVH
jgi:hypothetical protein